MLDLVTKRITLVYESLFRCRDSELRRRAPCALVGPVAADDKFGGKGDPATFMLRT